MKSSRDIFDKFANEVTKGSGNSTTFLIAFGIIFLWLVTGPIFKFSDTWQLVINTFTSLITFLMVFIIQRSQNKDTIALQLKLNELIAANKLASNRLINIEDLTEEDLETLKDFYIKLSVLAQKEMDIKKTHSIEEATNLHNLKRGQYKSE